MNANDAIELLLKMTAAQRSPANLELAASICRELGYLALAVAQAGAYIARSCSLEDYLHIYREDRAQLLQRHSPHAPDDYQWTVYTTWEMSLKKLPPTATMFLRICSFMHHGGISRAIFENAAIAKCPGELFQDGNRFLCNFKTMTGEWSRLAFLEYTKDLLAYSLVNLDTDTHVYAIHPLVHAWARDRATPAERDEARMCALQILALAVGYGNLQTAESLTLQRSLLPHVDVCRTADMEPEVAAQLHHVYIATGRWNIAEELLNLALDARRALLGNEHQDTMMIMGQLVCAYNGQGRWKEAEELELRVMEVARNVLGEEHPYTLTRMGSLVNIYYQQKRWQEAEELALQVVEVMRRVLGEEHLETLMGMGHLANIYREQGRPEEAEQLELRVMEVRRRVLGEEHPDTLMCMGNLATTYFGQGRWKEAEELMMQVVEVRRRVLGKEHPSTLTSMGNLALTYREQGRRKEAEQLELRVMEVRRRVLGEEHPHTLISMSNLACTFLQQGRQKEAKELALQVLEKRNKVLGDNHPSTLATAALIASMHESPGSTQDSQAVVPRAKPMRALRWLRRIVRRH